MKNGLTTSQCLNTPPKKHSLLVTSLFNLQPQFPAFQLNNWIFAHVILLFRQLVGFYQFLKDLFRQLFTIP